MLHYIAITGIIILLGIILVKLSLLSIKEPTK